MLATVGNNAFTQLELEGYELPKRVRKELNSLSMTDLQQIQTAAQGMEGWWGDIARFMTFMYPYTGVRPSELRRALVQDINVRTWMFYVRHPKGEKKYGEKRTVPILPPARPAVLAFLEARKVGLNGRECDILVPTLRGSALDTYSENVWRRIKRNVAERAALPEQDWSLRSFRETYCQLNIDRDKNLMSAVSKAMGHGSTNTTEKYYGRIRQEAANNALVASWESASPGPTRAI